VLSSALKENQGFEETNVLLTKGGWWDHSDGNRISTTLGDKIEIIQGHYKMLILGRQPDPTLGVIRDHSGGLTQENNQTPSNCVKSIEFTQKYMNGELSIYQVNGIGNVYSAFYGNVGDVYFGKLKESWTGLAPDEFTSEFYADSLKQDPVSAMAVAAIENNEDPDIKDYTWAKSITSWTGSETKVIPTIEEHTFATSITGETGSSVKRITSIVESTYAESTTSTTDVSGAITETTNAGSVTSTTTVSGAVTETTTVGGAITGTTTAAAITEVTMSAAHTEVELVGVKTNVFVGALDVDLYAALLKLEASIGFNVEVNLSQKLVYTQWSTVHIGAQMEDMTLGEYRAQLVQDAVAVTRNLVGAAQFIGGGIVQLGTAVGDAAVAAGGAVADLF
jgi:hypothetical protein